MGEWDPGVVSSSQRGDEPPDLGTLYDVVARFGKSTVPLVSEIEEWAPPRRVALTTSSKRFDAVDTITFLEIDVDRTRVVYVAGFKLKGAMRLLTPVAGQCSHGSDRRYSMASHIKRRNAASAASCDRASSP